MPITEAQRAKRRKYLGSSDAPAIVGVNPWRNAADVYWDKIRPPSDNESKPLSDAVIVGNMCEQAVLEWFSRETGKKILRNQQRVHENGTMAASFDALVVGEDEAVEAKTTGIVSPLNKEEWGEIETDQVPNHIIIQCQHQMAVLPQIKVVWVPVLLGGVGFRKYRIERNDDLIAYLEKEEIDFWKNHVETRIPPPDDVPTLETIKRIERQPKKSVALADGLVSAWLMAKEEASRADKAKEETQRAILAALGDAEGGECSFGQLTYFEQTRKETVIPESVFRVARFKKFKKEAA